MNFAIVYSKKDTAGKNIASFIDVNDFPKYSTNKKIVDAEYIGKEQNIKEDFIIFASKHQGKQAKILSIHTPGNWTNERPKLGGKAEKICKTYSNVLKIFFQELNKNSENLKNQGWETTLEVTHHGPLINKPCLFIEIGSNKENWQNKNAGEVIAKTIESAIKKIKNLEKENKNSNKKQIKSKYKTAIGIGGPHYCPNFNKIQLSNKSKIAISHIIPQYALPLKESMIKEAINKTIEKVSLVLLDWKGLGKSESRKQVINILEKMNLRYKRTSEIEK